MKIQIKTQLNPTESVVDTILKDRGLTRDWFTAGETDLLDGRTFRNFEAAKNLLKDNLTKNIAIYVDSDTDGFCSSSIIYMWLKSKYNIQPKVIIPEGKVHGIIPTLIPDDIDLLIVPDASSSEALIHKGLIEKGIKILVLDHHEFNLENGEYATIINPQHPDCTYGNKSISGTGVTYKFTEGIDVEEGVDYHSKYLDLVAIATVAVVMNIGTMDNKALVNLGLKNLQNPYFTTFHKFDGRSKMKKVTPGVISWYLVPPINGLIRVGNIQDKTELFQAMVGELPAEMVVANVTKLKGKQDRQKEPIIVRIAMNLNAKPDSKTHAVIMTDIPSSTPKAMTGLIAGQMTNLYHRPIFLGHIVEKNLIGSARNVNDSSIENLKDFCLGSGLFNWAAGHQSAFGYSIPLDKIDAFLTYCDNNLPPYEPTYHADFRLEGDRGQVILDIAELEPHYAPGFPDVVIYDEMLVKPSEISLRGDKKTTLVIQKNDIEYITFNFKDELPMFPSYWRIIGEPAINEWNGQLNPQVKLKGWSIEQIDL